MSILAIDYGKKKVGFAILVHGQVFELPIIRWNKRFELQSAVRELLQQYPIKKVILGKPSYGPVLEEILQFGEWIETLVPVTMHSEDLTTSQARIEVGLEKNKRASRDEDSVAARLLLEDYLSGYDKKN